MITYRCYADVAEWQTQQTQNLPPSKRAGSSPAIRTIFLKIKYARVVELADSLDSGSSVHYGRAGSSPASRTMIDP